MDTSPKLPDEPLAQHIWSMDVTLIMTAVLFGGYSDYAALYGFVKCCKDFYNICSDWNRRIW